MLKSSPIGFSRSNAAVTVHGKLRFRGGVQLRSPDRAFGGLSGLLVSADGTSFVAVSDEAHWVIGMLQYEDGDLVGATGTTIAPLLDPAGEPLTKKSGDAEGLASTSGNDVTGDLIVSFEGEHRVWRYPFAEDGVRAVPQGVPVPSGVLGAPRNGGLEGITSIGDGLLFAVSERHRDKAGDYHAWVLRYEPSADADAPQSRSLPLRPLPPFTMTDVRQLPGGDLLTLERRYAAASGVGVQMRRIPRAALDAAVRSDAGDPLDGEVLASFDANVPLDGEVLASLDASIPLDGEVLANFDASFRIDNMEGLAVRVGERGETLVYAVSDDNYNGPVQSTLLILYELLP